MEEPVTFPVGSISLEGLISVPPKAAIAAVVCHPHPLRGGEMRNNVVTALVEWLGRAGIATLRFNFRGVGRSGGVHDDGTGEVDDVRGALDCLLARGPFETVVVAGYSFGSIVGLMAGAEDARVDKLIGVALPIANRDASFLAQVAKPKLIIAGDRDHICPRTKLDQLYATLPEPKSLSIVTGADHFFGGLERDIGSAAVRFLA